MTFSTLKPSTKPLKRSAIKPRRPKSTPIRRAARGQDCTLRIPGVCNWNPETTVLCHSNKLSDGKGICLKAPDTCAAFGCSACHDVLDGRAPRPTSMTQEDVDRHFYCGMKLTQSILEIMGLLKC